MSRRARHRFDPKEHRKVLLALTDEEKEEYNGLVLGNTMGPLPANNLRLRELERAGHERIRKGTG